MLFSERLGIINPSEIIQLDTINDALKSRLWNFFYEQMEKLDNKYANDSEFPRESGETVLSYIKKLRDSFYKLPHDSIQKDNLSSTISSIRTWFFDNKTPWYKIYDIIEFSLPYRNNETKIISKTKTKPTPKNNSIHIVRTYSSESETKTINKLNTILSEENSGYRYIQGCFAPITNQQEIESIQTATTTLYEGVNTHFITALQSLSRKENPDYRNSIKESISAIESLVRIIIGQESITLGRGLNFIKNDMKMKIDDGLITAYKAIYTRASDTHGIRHGFKEQSDLAQEKGKTDLAQEDALYMLISCSAFTNYLITKYNNLNPSTLQSFPPG